MIAMQHLGGMGSQLPFAFAETRDDASAANPTSVFRLLYVVSAMLMFGLEGWMEGKLCQESNFPQSPRNAELGTRGAWSGKSAHYFPSRFGPSARV
ncbi:hypothetical protein RCCS2_13814 [Roseobacter sp. CCS2]|nr:hypothetical protein RCCS2_13814 [Roseobacter sp. CCS2]